MSLDCKSWSPNLSSSKFWVIIAVQSENQELQETLLNFLKHFNVDTCTHTEPIQHYHTLALIVQKQILTSTSCFWPLKTATVFLESSNEIWQFLRSRKKLIFKPNISRILFRNYKHFTFFKSVRWDRLPRIFGNF